MKRDSPSICIKDIQTLARDKGKMMSVTFEQRRRDGSWQQRAREVYDNGGSAVVLPYDANRNTVLMTRQVYLQDGIERTIEACAARRRVGGEANNQGDRGGTGLSNRERRSAI